MPILTHSVLTLMLDFKHGMTILASATTWCPKCFQGFAESAYAGKAGRSHRGLTEATESRSAMQTNRGISIWMGCAVSPGSGSFRQRQVDGRRDDSIFATCPCHVQQSRLTTKLQANVAEKSMAQQLCRKIPARREIGEKKTLGCTPKHNVLANYWSTMESTANELNS